MMRTNEDFDKAVARDVKAIRKAVDTIAAGDETAIDAFRKASDRAYKHARFASSPETCYAAIENVRAGFEPALEAGREVRQADRNAEIKRLREEIREANRNSPTAWMRS